MGIPQIPPLVPKTRSETKATDKEQQMRKQRVWLSRIEKEEKAHKTFRDKTRKVEKNFNSSRTTDDLYVPLYWQVVNVQHVGVYSAQPKADVRPRNEHDNPLFKQVAKIIQRGLDYCIDDQSFDDNFNRAVDDYLAMALGVCRVKIDSIFEEFDTGQRDFFNQPKMEERLTDQTIRWEYVPWARFGWEPCNSWKNCSWIYFRHRMTQAQIRQKFGRTVRASKDENDRTDPNSWMSRTYDIYEIWDKKKREVVFIAKNETVPVLVKADPLELKGFYPIPAPMMMNLPSEEMIPKADYHFIKHYEQELNRLQERRMHLLEQIKAAGAYDQGMKELADMLTCEDGEMIPVQNLMGRISSAGGADGMLYWLPIQEKVEALAQLTQQITFVKSQVDSVLGIADIVMGTTKASESATAQDIKGRWVGIRLTRKRETVQYTVREMMRIMAQLFCSHISPENMQRMTQMQMTEELHNIMVNDTLMDFVVDIETESTVAKDEYKERETHQEMLNGIAQFSQAVLPMVQQNLMPADTSSAILKTALEPYARYSKSLAESLNSLPTTQQQLMQMTQQIQQLNGQLQQSQMQLQQWQGVAQKLQMEATQATALLKQADAEKKTAETEKIRAEIPNEKIEPLKTAAEVGKLRAETFDIRQNPRQGGNWG